MKNHGMNSPIDKDHKIKNPVTGKYKDSKRPSSVLDKLENPIKGVKIDHLTK